MALVAHLSLKWQVLPSTLYQIGVEILPESHIVSGGFGNISRGLYQGKNIALKSLRDIEVNDDPMVVNIHLFEPCLFLNSEKCFIYRCLFMKSSCGRDFATL